MNSGNQRKKIVSFKRNTQLDNACCSVRTIFLKHFEQKASERILHPWHMRQAIKFIDRAQCTVRLLAIDVQRIQRIQTLDSKGMPSWKHRLNDWESLVSWRRWPARCAQRAVFRNQRGLENVNQSLWRCIHLWSHRHPKIRPAVRVVDILGTSNFLLARCTCLIDGI